MRSSFLSDKQFSEMYEKHFATMFKMDWNETNKDDHGIDLFDVDKEIYIDVKCYTKPKFVKCFTGIFIETYLPLSGRNGWLFDENKKTTHYLFIKNCSREKVEYEEAWLVKRENVIAILDELLMTNQCEYKEIASAGGYILPYNILNAICEKRFKQFNNENRMGA